MKKNYLISLLLAILLLISTACTGKDVYTAAVIPSLTITGDVGQEITLSGYEGFESVTITYNSETIRVLPLWQVLQAAGQVNDDATICFTAPDGIMSVINASELKGSSYLYLGSEYGWQFISENHPPQSRVKYMDKIVVSTGTLENEQKCLRIMSGSDMITLTYGQLFLEDAVYAAVWEADAKSGEYTVSVNTRRALIPISNYVKELGQSTDSKAIAYFADGSQAEINLNGYIEWRGNTCDYIGIDQIDRMDDLIGIWIDPPVKSITDVAGDALGALQEGRVLVIELDGLGYHDLVSVSPEFLSSHNISPARTVMPSVSSVSLAALITGLTPDQNGIYEEGIRQLDSDDMFVAAADMGKSCTVVEGASQLINMSIDQTLSPDRNGNGSTDDEVYEGAADALSGGSDLIFVHFHGYDDVSHTYGPLSDQAIEKIYELDTYVADLCANFSGIVLILSDHGQYGIDGDGKLGEHGEFRPLSMTIPYIKIKVAN